MSRILLPPLDIRAGLRRYRHGPEVREGPHAALRGEPRNNSRADSLSGRSVFALVRSGDGRAFRVDDEPVMVPATEGDFAIYEHKGIEDPRITEIDGTYYIMYTAASGYGPRLALARTVDFVDFERCCRTSSRRRSCLRLVLRLCSIHKPVPLQGTLTPAVRARAGRTQGAPAVTAKPRR